MKTYLVRITTLLLFIALQGCVTNDLNPDSEKKYTCPHKGWN